MFFLWHAVSGSYDKVSFLGQWLCMFCQSILMLTLCLASGPKRFSPRSPLPAPLLTNHSWTPTEVLPCLIWYDTTRYFWTHFNFYAPKMRMYCYRLAMVFLHVERVPDQSNRSQIQNKHPTWLVSAALLIPKRVVQMYSLYYLTIIYKSSGDVPTPLHASKRASKCMSLARPPRPVRLFGKWIGNKVESFSLIQHFWTWHYLSWVQPKLS